MIISILLKMIQVSENAIYCRAKLSKFVEKIKEKINFNLTLNLRYILLRDIIIQ